MENTTKENEIIKFLKKEFKVSKKDALKVIGVLSSDEGDLDSKLRKIKKFNIKNIDSIVTGISVFVLENATINSYLNYIPLCKESVVKLLLSPQEDVVDLILQLTSFFQCKLSAATTNTNDKFSVFLLLFPLFQLTGVVSSEVMTKMINLYIEENKISLKSLLQISNNTALTYYKGIFSEEGSSVSEEKDINTPPIPPYSETIH